MASCEYLSTSLYRLERGLVTLSYVLKNDDNQEISKTEFCKNVKEVLDKVGFNKKVLITVQGTDTMFTSLEALESSQESYKTTGFNLETF